MEVTTKAMATIIPKVDMAGTTEEVTIPSNNSNPRMAGITIPGTTLTIVVGMDRIATGRHRRMLVPVGKEWVAC